MRVAVVHDWLVTYAGAERVLEQILACFPDADLFALVDFLADDERGFIGGRRATTSLIQRLPFASKHFRKYLPFFPFAIQQLDLSDYDLVISSSHCVAKGVITGPDQLHVCCCYSPVRYAWDLQHEYLRQRGLDSGLRSLLARRALHRLRQWDAISANGVDKFVAISDFIARRIQKAYRRGSTVIYPPVALEQFTVQKDKEDFFLTASRQVPYKRVPLIVEAFAKMPERRLVVIGDGPEAGQVRAAAQGCANIEIMGYQSSEVLGDHMARAKAFIFAGLEDFGIINVEAQACGTPVIAYGKGGARETVADLHAPTPTGLFFEAQTVEAICATVDEFDANRDKFSADNCRANAERFSVARFRSEFSALVEKALSEY